MKNIHGTYRADPGAGIPLAALASTLKPAAQNFKCEIPKFEFDLGSSFHKRWCHFGKTPVVGGGNSRALIRRDRWPNAIRRHQLLLFTGGESILHSPSLVVDGAVVSRLSTSLFGFRFPCWSCFGPLPVSLVEYSADVVLGLRRRPTRLLSL